MKSINTSLSFVESMFLDEGVPLTKFIDDPKFSRANLVREFKLQEKREMGLYVFWWDGKLKEINLIPQIEVTAPGKKSIKLQWRKEDFPSECQKSRKYPLYIGKTTTFVDRIAKHLHLSKDWKDPKYKPKEDKNGPPNELMNNDRLRKYTSSCQFRSGIEHLLGYPPKETLIEELKNVSLSFFRIPKVALEIRTDVSERFYLEDLAIGYYRPWFNVDSER